MHCPAKAACPVVFADLDGDGNTEAITISNEDALLFRKQAAGWKFAGAGFVNNAACRTIATRGA